MTRNGGIARITNGPADASRGHAHDHVGNRSAVTLRTAAKLVENTAFAEARNHPTEIISQLITAAAELERLAHTLERAETVD